MKASVRLGHATDKSDNRHAHWRDLPKDRKFSMLVIEGISSSLGVGVGGISEVVIVGMCGCGSVSEVGCLYLVMSYLTSLSVMESEEEWRSNVSVVVL